MAGHSHWAGIKHKKARVDAVRGKIFSKHSRAITVAARSGGGDPDMNLTLKYAIDAAKADNMPKDNIERAVKKGTGELEGEDLEEVKYEGYWTGGVAVMVDVLTDNKNRTGPEIKKIFSSRGASLGNNGCVAYLFDKRSVILVKTDGVDEDKLFEVALEAGAEDVQREGEVFQIVGGPTELGTIKDAIEAAGIEVENAEITMIPQNTVPIADAEAARKVLAFMEELEDHDDVQKAYSNFDIPDEVMEQLSS